MQKYSVHIAQKRLNCFGKYSKILMRLIVAVCTGLNIPCKSLRKRTGAK